MQLLDGQLIFSATDLVAFLACEHLADLERAALAGLVDRPIREDPELDLIARRGDAHERRYLAELEAIEGRVVTTIEDPGGGSLADLEARAQATLEAMRRGDDVIYQATLFDGRWRGHADFLMRVETPSPALGAWSYDVADTKLARHAKASALLQMCSYADQVARLQGRQPETMSVVLGGSAHATASYRVADFMAYYRRVKQRFETTMLGGGPVSYPPTSSYPEPVEHCDVCRWISLCARRRRADDHLSLVAGMRADQARKLRSIGVGRVTDLAQLKLPMLLGPERMGAAGLERVREQARLQVEGRAAKQVLYELLDLEVETPDKGLAALPPPSPGDLFLDLEGDPWAEDDGLEFLFGIVEPGKPDDAGKPTFHAFWAHDRAQEKVAFEQAVDLIMDRLATDPGLHVYHYAPYEPSAFKRLMGRHGTREAEIDALLRAGVFVDLFRVVCQSVRVSTESYSIKKLEPLYGLTRVIPLVDAGSAVLKYEAWIERHDQALLDEIGLYNEDDCLSAWRLRDWLEERRDERASKTGRPVPRPTPGDLPSPELEERARRVDELAAQLLADHPSTLEATRLDESRSGSVDAAPLDPSSPTADPSAADPSAEQQARWLLAHLLSWHRREDKSDWWRWYALQEMTDEQLSLEADALGELSYIGERGRVRRSIAHGYAFDPEQDYRIDVGDAPDDPATGRSAGTVHALDPVRGEITLLHGPSWSGNHPRSLIPSGPIETRAQQAALIRLGEWVLEHGIDTPGPYRAARDLLLGRPPRLAGIEPGAPLADPDEDQTEAARRLGLALDGGCLPIQGPPGSGKTYAGARMIVDLVRAGRRVGIAATSHRVVTNLLDGVMAFAAASGLSLDAIQKAGEQDDRSAVDGVAFAARNSAVRDALLDGSAQVAAGTPWLWSHEDLLETVDTLVVDEAGQMSLANVLAMAGSARNIVLLGDPQQLSQPSKGAHPPGAEQSALSHALRGHQTVPADRGLFLATTWRLHPDLSRFISETFYEDRLFSQPSLIHQRIDAAGPIEGTGIRWVAVHHEGNRNASKEEAAAIRTAIEQLLDDGRFVDRHGDAQRLTQDQILVVAPYNAHVARVRQELAGAGLGAVRVGTVDKFQGQEAPVVFYSMATSTPELAPRGMDFLYSLNRLNVAISRARALAVLVSEPRLLQVSCRTPDQLRLANALCRLVEHAGQGPAEPSVAIEVGG